MFLKKYKYMLFAILFLNNFSAGSAEKKTIEIEGNPDQAQLSDIELPKYNYDTDAFDADFQAKKNLINMLENPEELTGIEEKDLMLNFPIQR